jgi:glycosyltransferase involved in cell wall biosynthesis
MLRIFRGREAMYLALIGPTYPFRGGVAHFTTLLARRLRERHTLAFYSYLRQYPRWLFPGSTASDPSAEALREPCERIIDSLNPLTYLDVSRRIAAGRLDALILQWWTPFWLPLHAVVAASAHRAGVPVVYLCHQLVEPDSSPAEWQVARLGLHQGDGFVLMTGRESQAVARAFPGRPVRAAHLPVFDEVAPQRTPRAAARALLGVEPDEPLLLFFGFVRRYKGLPLLLEALAQLPEPPRLIVAGDFWEDERVYRAQIARLGLAERVIIHNRYIPNESVEPYFAAADALVLPYLSGSQSGVAMLAVHHGLPVIASDVGGLGETVRDGVSGLVVPRGNAAALAQAIRRFYDERLAEQFQAAIAEDAGRLSWAALIDKLEDVIHELTGAAGHAADPSLRRRTGLQ